MAIDADTVRKIAFLSRLKVDDDKIEDTKDEFNKILTWVEELNEVDTNGVEPLVSVNQTNLTMRNDVVTDGNQPEAVLANAPLQEYGYFAVPKVIE